MPRRDFEVVVVPHLDAAFNYARWLTKNDADAEDVVQDATIRALRCSAFHPDLDPLATKSIDGAPGRASRPDAST